MTAQRPVSARKANVITIITIIIKKVYIAHNMTKGTYESDAYHQWLKWRKEVIFNVEWEELRTALCKFLEEENSKFLEQLSRMHTLWMSVIEPVDS